MRQTELNRYQAEQDSLAEQERQLQQVQIRTDKMLQSLNKQADTDQAEIIKDTDKLVPQPASATTKPTTTSMDELVALLQQKVVSTLTAKFDLPTRTTEDESAEPPAKRLKTQASPTPTAPTPTTSSVVTTTPVVTTPPPATTSTSDSVTPAAAKLIAAGTDATDTNADTATGNTATGTDDGAADTGDTTAAGDADDDDDFVDLDALAEIDITQFYTIPTTTGPAVSTKISDNVNNDIRTESTAAEEKILIEKFLCPSNTPNLKVPSCNKMVWTRFKKWTRNRDLEYQKIQLLLQGHGADYARDWSPVSECGQYQVCV